MIQSAYFYERDKIMNDPEPENAKGLNEDDYKLFCRIEAYLFIRNQVLNVVAEPGKLEPNRALWLSMWNMLPDEKGIPKNYRKLLYKP